MRLLNILLIAAIIVGIVVAVSFYNDPKSRELDERAELLQERLNTLEKEVRALKENHGSASGAKSDKPMTPKVALRSFERDLPSLHTGEELEHWVMENRSIFLRMRIEHRKLIDRIIYGTYDKAGKSLRYSSSEKRMMYDRYREYHKHGLIKHIEDLRNVIDNTKRK